MTPLSPVPNLWALNLGGFTAVISPYMVFNGVGLIVGLLLLDRILHQRVPKHENIAYTLFVGAVFFGWFGAHVLDWLVKPYSFLESGFTFYGGLISGVLLFGMAGLFLLPRIAVWQALNAATIPLVIGHAIGRVGCFFAGCCYGHPLNEHPLFDRHPTQLYEAGFLSLLAILLFRVRDRYPLRLVPVYVCAYGIFRFAVEFLRADLRGGAYALSTSQWVSVALLICTAVAIAVYVLRQQPRLFWQQLRQ